MKSDSSIVVFEIFVVGFEVPQILFNKGVLYVSMSIMSSSSKWHFKPNPKSDLRAFLSLNSVIFGVLYQH